MGKSDYVQLTVRLPPKFYQVLESMANKYSLTLQDTMLLILYDYLEGCKNG